MMLEKKFKRLTDENERAKASERSENERYR